MRAGKRSVDVAAESHELTALNEDVDDAGDDDIQGQENGQTALLGNNSKSKLSVIREETAWVFIYNILTEYVLPARESRQNLPKVEKTAPTLLFTTVGLTFSGEVVQRVALDIAPQSWQAIKRVDELYILIPMLNNLKGNLEMNLSSRLSTAANIGDLDDVLTRRSLVLGNLALLQVQALIVSAIAAILSFVLGFALSSGGSGAVSKRNYIRDATTSAQVRHKSGFREFIVLLASSMTAASMSSVVLGSFMCSLVLICRRYSRNPDNITPPIASCLGDLLTLCVIGLISAILVRGIDTVWPILLLIALIGCCALTIYVSLRNEHVGPLVSQGWIPLLGAMLISSGTGMVLDKYVNQFESYGLLAIVIGGLPGSVGSVLVSRLSTSLHAAALHKPGVVNNRRDTTLMLTLFGITLPVLFMFLVFLQLSGWTHLPILFLAVFVPAFCITVILSLFIARFLTQFLWNRNLDPDSYAMPIQSSVVDLIVLRIVKNMRLVSMIRMMSSDRDALTLNSPRVSIESSPSPSTISVINEPMKPLSSAQERRLTTYIDEQLLEIQRDFKKRQVYFTNTFTSCLHELVKWAKGESSFHELLIKTYRGFESSSLRTVDDYIEAVRPLLTLVLLIPPVGTSISLRSALFLRLTDEILDSITGYVPATFDQVLDILGELDRGWVAVLRSQGWNSVDKIGESIPGSLSLSSISQTDRTRLRSLLSSGTDKIEEWIETVLPNEAEAEEPAAAMEGMKLRQSFNDLFFQTLADLGELHGDIRLDETDSEDEEYEKAY